MKLKKLFADLKRCKNTPETRHVVWKVVFDVDDRDFAFAFLPTIIWMPSIYRYPRMFVIEIWWLNFHIGIGQWLDKEK